MVKTGEWIGEAWNKVVKGGNLGKFALLALGYLVISLIIGGILFFVAHPGVRSFADLRSLPRQSFPQKLSSDLLGIIVSGAIAFPVEAAIYAIILHFLRTGEMVFDRWRDISPKIIQIMLAGLVIGLFSAVGSNLWVAIGAIVSMLYMFTLPVLLESKSTFWQAMEESRKKVMKTPLGFLHFIWFSIVVGIVSALGVVVLGVGLLVSIPIGWTALLVAYRTLWAEEPAAAEIAERG